MRRTSNNPVLTYGLGLCSWLLLLGLDILSAQGLFAPIYEHFGLRAPHYHALIDEAWIVLVATTLYYIACYYLSETYMLVSKYAIAVAIPLSLGGIIALGRTFSYELWFYSFFLLGSLWALYDTYQREYTPHTYLRLGLLFAAMCYIDSRTLLLLPLWLYWSYAMVSISLRNILAFVLGIVAPAMVYALYLLYSSSIEGALVAVQDYITPLLSPQWLSLDWGYSWPLVPLMLFLLVAALSYSSGRYQESIRQRAQGSVLVASCLYGMLCIPLYGQAMLVLLPLMAGSILVGRGIDQLGLKPRRIVLALLFALLLGITLIY